MMTLDELISDLRNLSAAGHGEAEVRISYQPNYPLQANVGEVKLHLSHQVDIEEAESFIFNSGDKYPEDAEDARQKVEQWKQENTAIIYILEGGGGNYAPSGLWED